MLTRILKVLTLLLLIYLLAFLVLSRDITLFIHKKTKEVISSQSKNDVSLTSKQQEEVNPSLKEARALPLENKNYLETATPTKSVEQTKEIPKKIVDIPKNSVYDHMVEGQSDTDESYRPVISPCVSTMGYRLGSFDTRFGISKSNFINEINNASSLWGAQLGKTLFRYDENGSLTINLIYDERQVRTDEINYLILEIENSKKAAEELRATYEQEKIQYLREAEQFTKDSENFKMRNKAYADKIAIYNAQGGASRIEYDAMNNELNQLKQEVDTLEERRLSLISFTDLINKKVTKYNEFVVYINNLIKKSNAFGAKKFIEGKFSPTTNTIDIYQYNDTIKLSRVVSHELGHVLGINHNNNSRSIMYSYNTATTTVLSKEDIRDLHAVCPN